MVEWSSGSSALGCGMELFIISNSHSSPPLSYGARDYYLACSSFLARRHHFRSAECICNLFYCLCNDSLIKWINKAFIASVLNFFCKNDGDFPCAVSDFFNDTARHDKICAKDRIVEWVPENQCRQINKKFDILGKIWRVKYVPLTLMRIQYRVQWL